MEHMRLQTLQSSLEAERVTLHTRSQEEYSQIKQKLLNLEIETRKQQEEKLIVSQDIQEQWRKLEADKADFAVFSRNATKSAELGMSRLKDEESRLNKLREELNSEKHLLEQRKVSAITDIQNATNIKNQIHQQYEEIKLEKQKLSQLALELQKASEEISSRDAQLNKLESSLAEREAIVQHGVIDMNEATRQLSMKESEVLNMARKLELQQGILEEVDRELIYKKLAVTTSQRELSALQAQATMKQYAHNRILSKSYNPPVNNPVHYNTSNNTYLPQNNSTTNNLNSKSSPVSIASASHSPINKVPMTGKYTQATAKQTYATNINPMAQDEYSMIRDELEKAKTTLDKSKSFPMRNTNDVISNTQLFIDTESSFLNTIRTITSQGLHYGK